MLVIWTIEYRPGDVGVKEITGPLKEENSLVASIACAALRWFACSPLNQAQGLSAFILQLSEIL